MCRHIHDRVYTYCQVGCLASVLNEQFGRCDKPSFSLKVVTLVSPTKMTNNFDHNFWSHVNDRRL